MSGPATQNCTACWSRWIGIGSTVSDGKPRLLERLACRRTDESRVAGLAVSAELEPLLGLAVQGEQHALWSEESTSIDGSEVVGGAASQQPVVVRLQVLDVPIAQGRGRSAVSTTSASL